MKLTIPVYLFLCVLLLKNVTIFSNDSNTLSYDVASHKKSPRLEPSSEGNSSYSRNSNMLLKDFAQKFAFRLKDLTDSELGVILFQNLYNTLKYKSVEDEGVREVNKLSERLQSKVSEHLAVLKRSISLIADFKQHSRKICFFHVPCIYISDNGSYEEPYNNSSFDFNNIPLSILNLTEGFASHTHAHEGQEARPNRNVHYFISEMEPERLTHVYSEDFPADNKCQLLDDAHFQRVFLKTVSSQPKQIVMVIDNGVSLNKNLFTIAKSVASHLVLSMSDQDRLAVLAISDSVAAAVPDSQSANMCSDGSVLRATDAAKHQFLAFIDDLPQSKGLTNHSLGFERAFKTIEESGGKESTIVYISRGLMSSIAEAGVVMEQIARGQDSVRSDITINTCMLVDGGKAILYEKHFLSAVTQQNFTLHNVSCAKYPGGTGPAGKLVSLNASAGVGPAVRSLCAPPRQRPVSPSSPTFFLPHWHVNKKGDLVISIAETVTDNEGNLLGVVGVDVPYEDLVEDFLYLNEFKRSYAFLMETSGHAIAHPLLRQPASLYQRPIVVDIGRFETCPAFVKIRDVIFRNNSGLWKTNKEQLWYSWKHVGRSPYIVVAVASSSHRAIDWPLPTPARSPARSPALLLAHHRLDLRAPPNVRLCANYRQVASTDTGTLFLGGSCFQSPFAYLSEEDLQGKGAKSYAEDGTALLADLGPGLRPEVRHELAAVVPLVTYWRKLFRDSPLAKFIIRKYAVTPAGAVVMYPGGVLDRRLDVGRRGWYQRAMRHPGLVAVSPPYPDSAGAGHVVTASIALGDPPLTYVLAIDFTIGAMLRLLVDSEGPCSRSLEPTSANVKCFLMDDRGFLVAHPGLLAAPPTPAEQPHVTHYESLLANNLLNHKGLVQKLACNDFAGGAVERLYQFNVSLDHVVTNVISGKQCVHYRLTQLTGTNAFLGVVNATCDLATPTFCACNTVGRHCLICNRMEQTECECPCECPLECPSDGGDPQAPPCTTAPLAVPPPVTSLPSLDPCAPHDCDRLPTHRECLGVQGCEWCHLQPDALTPLPSPFCTQQPYCIGGAVTTTDNDPNRPSSPVDGGGGAWPSVGPLGGATLALLVALALMAYCYCRHGDRDQPRYAPAPAPDSSLHMFAIDKHAKADDPPTGASSGLVSNAQELSVALLSGGRGGGAPVPVSPYLLSSGYRRPPTGDSDHGYSTMSPHEEPEPPHSPSPTPSLSSALSSAPTPASRTLLPPHRVLVPVTVHVSAES